MEQRQPSDDRITPEANAELLAKIESQFGDEREKDNPLYKWLQNKERPVTDELEQSLPPAVQEMIHFLEVHDGTEQNSNLPESVQEAGRHTSVYTGSSADLVTARQKFKADSDRRSNQIPILEDRGAYGHASRALEVAMNEMRYMNAGVTGLLTDDELKGYMTTAYQVAAEVVRSEAAKMNKTPIILDNPFGDTKFMREVAVQLIKKDRAEPRYKAD